MGSPVDFTTLKLLVLDVDGVLTDGRIIYTANGDEAKCFNVKDGAGMKYWQRAGGQIAVITGRKSPLVARRADELGVTILREKCLNKLPVLEEVLAELNVSPEETAVIGDDLPDWPMMRHVGFSACPADAVDEVRQAADYLCQAPGGGGCVRETVEYLLRAAGTWDTILQRYLPAKEGS